MAMQVSGKTAIITGAGSGINLAFAKLLLSKGCNVIIADLSLRPESTAVVEEYSKSSSPRVIFQRTDVTKWEDLNAMFDVATKEFGGVDIVCPGAGVYEPSWSNFWQLPGEGISKDTIESSRYAHLDINMTHPIRTTQLAIVHFQTRGKPGCIPHISSIGAQNPFLVSPVYVATKAAISHFVRSLAELEHPPAGSGVVSIRVNAVAPGVVLTPLWTDSAEKLRMVDGRDEWITPERVAEAMLEMVQDEDKVGGTVWEVGRNVRKVELFNDPGPAGSKGNTVSNTEVYKNEIWEGLAKIGKN